MAFQTQSNKQISIKRQSGLGVPASGAGAAGYNVFPSPGLKLLKGIIPNNVIRRDGQSARGRHGSKSGSAVYKLPLSQGTLDPLLEAGFRGTFTATFDITQATTLGGSAAATSITTTTTTIVAAAGDWRLQGVHKGSKVKLTGHSTAANNGKWFRVVDVTALVITLANKDGAVPLVTDAVADASFTLTVSKNLQNPTTLIERYHTIEEVAQDLVTKSLLGTDMKICKIEFNAQPDQLIEMTITFMGLDVAGQAAAPVLTNPTYSTTLPLVLVDGTIRIAGVDYSVITGFQWTWDMGGEVPKVLGPSPDVFLGPGKLSGNFSAIRQDLTFFNAFRGETQVDFFLDCLEPDLADPKDFTSFYIGNATLSDDTTAGIAASGPDVETAPWNAGIDDAGGASALTTMVISSSAP